MYGTVATLKVKPGMGDELVALLHEWTADMKPKIKGALSGSTYRLDSDPDTYIVTAVFDDKATYQANADSPEQDKWYQRMRALLAGDPEWRDGEVVQHD